MGKITFKLHSWRGSLTTQTAEFRFPWSIPSAMQFLCGPLRWCHEKTNYWALCPFSKKKLTWSHIQSNDVNQFCWFASREHETCVPQSVVSVFICCNRFSICFSLPFDLNNNWKYTLGYQAISGKSSHDPFPQNDNIYFSTDWNDKAGKTQQQNPWSKREGINKDNHT